MKIAKDGLEQIENLSRRYKTFKDLFDLFAQEIEWLNEERSQFKSIKVESHADKNYVEVSAIDVVIRIKFITVTAADGSLIPILATYRVIHGEEIKEVLVNRLVFNGQGVLDVEIGQNQDPFQIHEHGAQLIAQLLLEASKDEFALPAHDIR